MHDATLRLKCKRPEAVAKSLEPDIKNDEDSQTTIRTDKSFVVIEIKSERLSHMKAIVNSYLSLVASLNEIEEIK